MTLYGKVMSVETRNLSEPAVADAAIGATTLYVSDASTFDETGGFITVGTDTLVYTAIDVDNNTLTLATGLAAAVADQDLIEVYPPTPVKTALVDIGEDGGDSVPVTVPHALLDKLQDGTRDDSTAETVTIVQRGTYELLLGDIVAEQLMQTSLDYVEGEVGYGLSETVAQVNDLQSTGEIGAAVLSADAINLGGTDLSSIISPIPKSSSYAVRTNTTANKDAGPAGATELRVFTFNAGPVKAGRLYEVGVKGIGAGTVAGDWFWTRLRYTLDGSDPTTSSPLIIGSPALSEMSPGPSIRCNLAAAALFPCDTDGELRIAFTLNRHAGTGTVAAMVTPLGAGFAIWATDKGVNVDSSTALQQTAYSDGSGSDSAPLTSKSLTWLAIGTDNYSGRAVDVGAPLNSNNGTAYQGWWQSSYGPPTSSSDRPDFSLFHFNYADIVSKLAAATSVDSVKLTFKVGGRVVDTGLDVQVLSHTYTAPAPTLASNMAGEVSAGRITLGLASKSNGTPGSSYTLELGSTLGGQLKAGTRRGVGIYNAGFGSAGRGFVYGYPNIVRPSLTITFKSPA